MASHPLNDRLALARQLTVASGTATQEDVAAVQAEIIKLPKPILRQLVRARVRVYVCRGSVTEHWPHMRGRTPRGHPSSNGWEDVEGAALGRAVVIATQADRGRRVVPNSRAQGGSYNTVLHEVLHAYDSTLERFQTLGPNRLRAISFSRYDADFARAYRADLPQVDRPYLRQRGGAGLEETFAESGARLLGGDRTLGRDWPHLEQFWRRHLDALELSATSAASTR